MFWDSDGCPRPEEELDDGTARSTDGPPLRYPTYEAPEVEGRRRFEYIGDDEDE